MRVIRLVVYEGSEERVLKQLGLSLPEGVRDCGRGLTIRVVALHRGWFLRLRGVLATLRRPAPEAI